MASRGRLRSRNAPRPGWAFAGPERLPLAMIGIVIPTRDRRATLLRTLDRLEELPEQPPTVVVDNASSDHTAAAVRRRHPDVQLVRLPADAGPSARSVGARVLDTELIAFNDDDSWW